MATNSSKDFSILFTKINSGSSKKDISMVSNLNKIVQQIEHTFKTNPGELMSDPYFGSNYDQYKFMGKTDKNMLEYKLKSSLEYAIPSISNIIVKLIANNEQTMTFLVSFNKTDGVNTQLKTQCTIEVPLQ